MLHITKIFTGLCSRIKNVEECCIRIVCFFILIDRTYLFSLFLPLLSLAFQRSEFLNWWNKQKKRWETLLELESGKTSKWGIVNFFLCSLFKKEIPSYFSLSVTWEQDCTHCVLFNIIITTSVPLEIINVSFYIIMCTFEWGGQMNKCDMCILEVNYFGGGLLVVLCLAA